LSPSRMLNADRRKRSRASPISVGFGTMAPPVSSVAELPQKTVATQPDEPIEGPLVLDHEPAAKGAPAPARSASGPLERRRHASGAGGVADLRSRLGPGEEKGWQELAGDLAGETLLGALAADEGGRQRQELV